MDAPSAPSVYDELPYPGRVHAWTHPARLYAAARFLGLRPAPIDRCRVLEIGCADGTNLFAMAEALPHTEFVGFDYTARHIATGREIAAATGITNVRLLQADIRDFGAGEAPFDYIIAHGVYSWVPPDVRAALLRLCRRLLAPYGVAYISYNALPGWHPLLAMRSIALRHTSGIEEPLGRAAAARDLFAFLVDHTPDTGSIHSQAVRLFADALSNDDFASILHDELNDVCEAFYLTNFADQVEAEGLSYLHDARFSDVMQVRFDAAAMERLHVIARDSKQAEQVSDFLLNRSFRRSLICHEEREAEAHMDLTAPALSGFYLSGDFAVDAAQAGRMRSSMGPVLTPAAPVGAAALTVLGERFPASVPFTALLAEARARAGSADADADADAVAATLILAYSIRSEMITPWPCPPGRAITVTGRPAVSALNRYRAGMGGRTLSDAFSGPVEIDPVTFSLVPVLDGTRDHAALRAHLAAQYPGEGPATIARDLEDALAGLARAALLVP